MIRLELLIALALALLLLTRGDACAEDARGLKPRVVPTRYATEDVVVATAVATELPFGVKGDGVTDDTAALQKAIDAVAAVGGGVVFLPEGRYRIDGNLVVRETVTLRGDWTSPEHGVRGTILLITGGRGNADAKPTITLERGAGVRDLSLWWPDQKPDDIAAYPWAVSTSAEKTGDNTTVRNVTLVNAYQGIRIGPDWNELHLVRNVYGTVLKLGVWMDLTTDIGRIMKLRFSPRYWERSGLPGAPTSSAQKEALRGAIRQNATGIEMLRSDWEYYYDVELEGFGCGMRVLPGKNGTSNAVLFGFNARDCRIGLQIDALNPVGLAVTGCRFEGSESALLAAESFDTIAQFNACAFGGNPKVAVQNQGSGKFSFQNCEFENWQEAAVRVSGRGALNAFGCAFKQEGLAVDLGADAVRAQLLGNWFEGTPSIRNASHGDVQIDHQDRKFRRPDTRLVNLPPDPRPAGDRLLNVLDYGAVADGKSDNTSAFQKALTEAGKGGGTVYIPGGNYRFAGNLRVPSGVELRGCFDVPHHPVSGGSVLMPTAGRDQADATPFITLEARSGVRGVTFWNPEQNSNAVAPYPWVIRSLGPNCWVVDVALSNIYQGVDFGSAPSQGHLVRYLCGAPLKTGLRVSQCDGDGWVENVQFNPHYWARMHPSYPAPADDTGDICGRTIGYQNRHLDGLVFGRCRNEQVVGTFIFAAQRGLYFADDNGGANARVIQHGTDGATTDVTFDATGSKGVEMINAEFVPLFDTARYAVETTDGFSGKVSFFNTLVWGIGDTGHLAGSGEVLIQQVNSMVGPLTVAGGKARLENFHFQKALPAHVKATAGVKDLLLLGNTGKPSFKQEAEPGAKVESLFESRAVTR